MRAGCNEKDTECIKYEIGFNMILEQIAGNEKAVVQVENDEERKGNNTAVAQIFGPCNIESAPTHHEERKAEDNTPSDDMGQDFDKIGTL